MTVRRIWPEGVYKRIAGDDPDPRYAQVVEATRPDGSRSIHVAGTFGCDENQQLAPGGIRAQMVKALDNIRISLEAADATIGDIVRIKLYTTDMAAFLADATGETQAWFGVHRAASTAIGINELALPGAMIEIEVYAEVD